MKILQLIQKPQLRGAEIFACQLSNHLLEMGHEVIVVSIFKGSSELPFKGKLFSLDRPLAYRFIDIKGWNKFNAIIKEFNPDIIQANAADTLKFAVSSKLIFSWKFPIIFRNANKMGDFINSELKWKLNNFYLSKVTYVISVSKECEKDLIKTFRFSKNKIQTVEIGVENKILGDYPLDLKIIFDAGPVISHIGGFVPEKNHQGLIRIFKNIITEFPNVQLMLLGKGQLEEEIKMQVKSLNLEQNVHFLGYRNDVLNILNHSTAFVLPSLIEGLPAVILEAMYCRAPVVAYNVGGIGEIVVTGKTGWLIDKSDEVAFEGSLMKVLNESSDVTALKDAAKEMVSQKFSNEKIAGRFEECYKKVAKNPNTLSPSIGKMKILQIVTKRQYRGAELFAADLSEQLINLGHEVIFVGLYENNNDALTVDNADNRDLVKTKNNVFSAKIVKKIVNLVKEVNPDIIQCNGSDTLKYTVAASYFFKKVPLVYRNISIISEWISSRHKKLVYKKMFNRIAHVTSVGDEALADFIKTYNYPKKRAEVIRRGIPVKEVNKSNLSKILKDKLGFKRSDRIVIHIGNFSPEKNHDLLFDIFSDLRTTDPNIKLVCVGSGILFEYYKTYINQNKLSNTIFLLGFRKDIPELLAASDCLVLTSKIEGVPGVILEAATQKIPAIATNVGGVSEVLKDNQTGYLIENFDKNEFKLKLLKLMLNDKLRIRFGENAFKLISQGFNPLRNAEKFESLYHNLIQSNKSNHN